ncbi:MAG: CHASE domain-containing protein, partial [Pseudomonadota bacterium]
MPYYRVGQIVRGSKLVSEELQRKGRRRRWLIDYPRGIPVLIFVLVTAITVLSVFAIERGEKERDAADVARKAQAMTSAIERRAYTSSAYLRAGAALLSTQDEVTPELFRRFVSELRLDANYRGAEGIGWAPVISAGDVAGFETRLGMSRVEEKRVTPTLTEQPR